MKNLTARHIDENEARNRAVGEGWYAMRRDGTLRLGPFSTRDECLSEIARSISEPAPRRYWPGVH
jgi:hypothetical protein